MSSIVAWFWRGIWRKRPGTTATEAALLLVVVTSCFLGPCARMTFLSPVRSLGDTLQNKMLPRP
jgi:hypothetical protein